MSSAGPFSLLNEPCLKAHAFGAAPAWLWSVDGGQILWANAAGTVAFGAPSRITLLAEGTAATTQRSAELGRLSAILPATGSRAARLRSFSNGYGQPGLFSCSKVRLGDGREALLVVANDVSRKAVPLAERARGLLQGESDVAALGPDGVVLFATDDAVASAAKEARSALPGSGDEVRAGDVTLRTYPTEAGTIVVAWTRAETGGLSATQAPGNVQPAQLPLRALRFTWQTDAAQHFTVLSDDFVSLAGARTGEVQGKRWSDVAGMLGLDPAGAIASALASRQTWENIEAAWPVGDAGERLTFSLSAVPIRQSDGAFGGYRGFAQCRDAARISDVLASRRNNQLAAPRPAPTINAAPIAKKEPIAARQASTPSLRIERKPNPARREAAHTEQTSLTVVPAVRNIVPFRSSTSIPSERRASLSPVEHNAFQEIARALGARFAGDATAERADLARLRSLNDADPDLEAFTSDAEADAGELLPEDFVEEISRALEEGAAAARRRAREGNSDTLVEDDTEQDKRDPFVPALPPERTILDRMPVAALVYRGNELLYANRPFHDWTGFGDLPALAAAGGFARLFNAPAPQLLDQSAGASETLSLHAQDGTSVPVQGRLFSISWHEEQALLFLFTRRDEAATGKSSGNSTSGVMADEWAAILDIVADGVVVLDDKGGIATINRSAQALFGYDARQLNKGSLLDLLAPESHREALLYLDGIRRDGMQSVLNDGREVTGRTRDGGTIPLFMTIGRIHESPGRFCAVLRDLTGRRAADNQATAASSAHRPAPAASLDIGGALRAPLEAVLVSARALHAELQQLGGGERCASRLDEIQDQLHGIRQVVADATELGEIETHARTLAFAHVDVGELVRECIASTQPAALEARVVIRAALPRDLPMAVVDREAVQEVLLRLLGEAVADTVAGSQVIVSAASSESRVVIRLRHARPQHRSAEAGSSVDQTAANVRASLVRALVEANGGTLSLQSANGAGSLTEIALPAVRGGP